MFLFNDVKSEASSRILLKCPWTRQMIEWIRTLKKEAIYNIPKAKLTLSFLLNSNQLTWLVFGWWSCCCRCWCCWWWCWIKRINIHVHSMVILLLFEEKKNYHFRMTLTCRIIEFDIPINQMLNDDLLWIMTFWQASFDWF